MELRNKKYVSLEKQSKKARREHYLAQRTVVGFNTGTRIHKTDKYPSRARAKQMAQKGVSE